MEYGFFCPEIGYWQTISEPDADTLAGYPEGTISIPMKPGADHEWQDEQWVHVPRPPAIPDSLTRIEFKGALLQAGLLDQVETLMEGADPMTQLKWREATEFPRNDPMIDSLGAQIGLTPEQIDAMFIAAVNI